MKPHIITDCIVLGRVDYGEADRIITVLTPSDGKLSILAKGVRKPKSKLAGGVELFSVNSVTILPTQKDLKTLVSSRLVTHYGKIVTDINRTLYGYDVLKRLNRGTEDAATDEYYQLLNTTLLALNDTAVHLELITTWFEAQLHILAGQSPELHIDTEGAALAASERYMFDVDSMAFRRHGEGIFNAPHIKALRLLYGASHPGQLMSVAGLLPLLPVCNRLIGSLKTYQA